MELDSLLLYDTSGTNKFISHVDLIRKIWRAFSMQSAHIRQVTNISISRTRACSAVGKLEWLEDGAGG